MRPVQDPNDAGVRLERFRQYLQLLARLQLDARLEGKVDLSGVVQQTLLEAYQSMTQGTNQGSAASPDVPAPAWLRRVLANNLRDEVRKLATSARDAAREVPLEARPDARVEESHARLEAWLAADQSSPSQHAVRQEQLLALAEALAGLPDDQQRAVELHHLKGRPLAEVAQVLGRSKGAVAALLFRGLKRLRERLAGPQSRYP
jgi:RNA polymerase sigma-70 factor (ECF subfamily)